jgi:hypothetical protein
MGNTSVIALAISLAGCSAAVGEGVAELGTGEAEFEPLAEGQEVPIIHGAQGGYHVWLSAQVLGLGAQRVAMTIETRRADGTLPPETSNVVIPLSPSAETAGMRELVGWPAILADPDAVAGAPLHVSIRFVDPVTGVTAFDERTILPIASE